MSHSLGRRFGFRYFGSPYPGGLSAHAIEYLDFDTHYGSNEKAKGMIVTTKQLFAHAYGKYAVGAYNINNLEQTVGLFRGNLGKSDSNSDPTKPAASAPFIIPAR